MSAEITFKINKDGEVEIEVFGIQDASCEDITRCFEEALGTKVEINRKEQPYFELDGIEIHETEE